MGKVGGFHPVHAEIEGVGYLRLARLRALAAGRASLVHVPGGGLERDLKVPFLPRDPGDLGHREDLDPGIGLDPAEVDLEPAGGRAELREVLVELGHASAEVGVPLDEEDVRARFGRFDGRRETADPAADHKDGPVCRYRFRHTPPPLT